MNSNALKQIQPVQPYPALLLQKDSDRALVVSDLHIGWERLLIKRGVHIPSQTPKIKNMMLKLIKECRPNHLIFLGDVKDAIAKVEMEEWRDIPDFFEAINEEVADIQVILGNHDGNLEPLLPESIKIIPPTGAIFGDAGLFHGHAWPAPELLGCRSLITGHVHPTIAIRDPMGFRMTRQVWVKAPCEGKKLAKSLLNHLAPQDNNTLSAILNSQFEVKLNVLQLFIMPSFNQFLGGRAINERREKKREKIGAFIGPVLRSGSVTLDEAEVYLLDGTYLGTVNQLKALS